MRRAGVRRRGAELEAAIFDAALEQLTSSGYARLSMEAVATAARTGKASVYRRWPSKEELVLDALRSTLPEPGVPPATGSLRGDLLEVLDRLRVAMTSPPGCAARAVISELDHERAAAFVGFMHERLVDPVKQLLREVFAAAEARGEIRPGSVTPAVVDVIPALMMYRSKLGGGEFTPADARAAVDEVLLPIVRTHRPDTT
ncbi:TetR/AcrR family transcriptional regulator [Streptacidiphilus monticola]|uniref:TetR/AcrR family transcriptional regulator n=1 Tax=Streptacidiphilus monticola TaxID=2161674 RepID=A0ABW1G4T7_9ACTN